MRGKSKTGASAKGKRGVREKVLRMKARIGALARAHGARTVRLFGSAARGEERPDSDIDFLVELEPHRSLLDLIGLENDLADLFARKVEVVTIPTEKPEIRARAQRCGPDRVRCDCDKAAGRPAQPGPCYSQLRTP